MKIMTSRVILLLFMLLIALEPFAQAQAYENTQNSDYMMRAMSRYQAIKDSALQSQQPIEQEMRIVSEALVASPNKFNGIFPNWKISPFFTGLAVKWLSPVFAALVAFATVPTIDSFLYKAEAKEATESAPVEDTGSLVTRDYPVGTSGAANAEGTYGVDLEWRPNFSDPKGTWAFKAKGARYDRWLTKATDPIVPSLKTLKLSLKRIWDQEHKPYLGGGVTFQTPTLPEIQESFLGMGGTLWNQQQNFPLLGLTTLDHSSEFWLDYLLDVNSVRFPIMDKFNVESKELSLTTHAGYDPGTQKWIGFVQVWRHIGTFGGSVINVGYAKGWNSSGYHHFITLPTDNERFSLILHRPEGWDVQLDYLPAINEYGITVDLFRQNPAPSSPSNAPKSDPKSDKKSSSNTTGQTNKTGDNLNIVGAAGTLGGTFLALLRRKIEIFLKWALNQDRRLVIVFVEEVAQADIIAKNVMDYYNRDEKVLFVVKNMDILIAMEPVLDGKKTLALIEESVFNGHSLAPSYLRLEAVEQALPGLLKEGYKDVWVPLILKNEAQHLDFTGLASDALLQEKNIITMDIKALIKMVLNLKIGGFNLLHWNPVQELLTVMTSA